MSQDVRPRQRGKVKALLAGGLVLGVGAAVTLAAWTDQAHVDATFGTSRFNIEVDTHDGTGWQEGDPEAAHLDFTVDISDQLQPGITIYAPLSVRTDSTSVGGTVTLVGANQTGGEGNLFTALEYTVVETPTAGTCGPESLTGDPLVPAGSRLITGAEDSPLALGPAGAGPVHLCFAITLPEDPHNVTDVDELQGTSTKATWLLSATADDARPDAAG